MLSKLWTLTGVILFLLLQSCSAKNVPSDTVVADTIRVMTYNVHHCNPPEKPNLIDVDAIATVIGKENSDLVAVQEVDVNTNRSGKINQAQLLAQKAGYPYFYFGKAMDYDGGQYGVLILSKFRLSQTQTHALPRSDRAKDEPRVLAAALVTLPNGNSFIFGSTHLEAFNKSSRILQAEAIARIAEQSCNPFIVGGDFNDKEDSEVLGIFDKHFSRTCNNCPSTFWEAKETGAIDYIAFRTIDRFKVLSHRVIQNKEASDHMPVVAELSFK